MLVRCQAKLVMSSGLPDDAAVNVFFVNTPAVDNDGEAVIGPAWSAFMGDLQGSLSGRVAQNGHSITAYNMADEEPRVPIWTYDWNFPGAPSGASMPTEVALCVSFRADLESGSPAARRRGRIYIGPFDETPNNDGRPSSAFVDGIADAFQTFALALTDEGLHLVVWSRVDEVARTARLIWVDNAWDTQRRRGLEATSRETRTITDPP